MKKLQLLNFSTSQLRIFFFAISTAALLTLSTTAAIQNNDFETGNYNDWIKTGTAWGSAPVTTNFLPVHFLNCGLHGTYYANSLVAGEAAIGVLKTSTFICPTNNSVLFLLGGWSKFQGGGSEYNYVTLNLASDGTELDRVYTPNQNALVEKKLSSAAAFGKQVYIEVVDNGDSPSGYAWLSVDYFRLEETASEFEDVTTQAGLGIIGTAVDLGSIAWVDYNNDGRPDIHTCANLDGSLGVFLFKNVIGTGFVQTTVGCSPMQYPGIYADTDNDGDQDWYMSWAGDHGARNNNNGASFSYRGWPANTYQSECMVFGDFNNDSWLDIYRTGWEQGSAGPYFPDSIYLNAGNGTFTLNWEQSEVVNRAGRGVTTADFDEDGDMDIYVSNYRLGPNFLWINDGTANFTNLAREYGVEGGPNYCVGDGGATTNTWYGHSIGSTFCDLDNDGHLDLIVGNFDHNWSCGGNPDYQDPPKFYRNMGAVSNWNFEDKTTVVNLPYVESHASPATADFDNDGDLDFFISTVAGDYAGQKCTMMRNDGNWTFTDISVATGLDITTTEENFQAAWADYDNDGDLDLFTARKLFKNPLMNGNHWLKINLVGDENLNANRDAIGAIARIQLGTKTLTRQVDGAIGWNNQSEKTLHFGLGTNAGLVTVEVTWPNGDVTFDSYDVDQTVTMAIPEPFLFWILNFGFLILYITKRMPC